MKQALLSLILAFDTLAAPDPFQADILPIFKTHCFDCHSHSAAKSKGGLMLDSAAALAKGGESGPVLVPGNPEISLLAKAILRQDPDFQMPPKKPLDQESTTKIIQWIRNGAAGLELSSHSKPHPPSTWWATQPLSVPSVSSVRLVSSSPSHPLDAYLTTPSSASPTLTPISQPIPIAHLARRASLQLTGLLPKPQEIAELLQDPSPIAFENFIDRLLASPHYGERFARFWLDLAHFAETHGHDQDRIREYAWPYRDYLIQAFNSDLPFARFVTEQIAGDVAFPDDPRATLATGFLAAGPWDESGLRDIREDTIDRQIARYIDRDDVITTVMQTFTSTTVQCARCHDHKFDPITQEDYYSLQAVFSGIDRAHRRYDADPVIHARRNSIVRQQRQLIAKDPALLLSPETQSAVRRWEQNAPTDPRWHAVEPLTFTSSSGATITRLQDGSFQYSGKLAETDVTIIAVRSPLYRVTGLRLEALTDPSLPNGGPGRATNGNFHLNEIEFAVFPHQGTAPLRTPLIASGADFNQEGWTVQHAVDGQEKTAWGINPQQGTNHVAVFRLVTPATLDPDATIAITLKCLHGSGHSLGRFRLSLSDSAGPIGLIPTEVRAALNTPIRNRTEPQASAIASFYLNETLSHQLAQLPAPSLVYAGSPEFDPDGSHKPAGGPRPVFMLARGEISRPLREIGPGTYSCIPALPPRFSITNAHDEGSRRIALAQWLVHPDNPLTWRSIVNRVWQFHFGRGIVATPSDFGVMGAVPTHPELLDGLARMFRDDFRGSLKRLHRLILTSQLYRQPAVNPSQPLRVPAPLRRRLDAEEIRDVILQVSGTLNLRMGGPSDREFDLKPGIHVTPSVDYAKFQWNNPLGTRRAIYRFLFRTLPDPFMEALDSPSGDQLTAVRLNQVTSQEALALWNDSFVTHHAELWARSLEKLSGSTATAIEAACLQLWGRRPSPAEMAGLGAHAREFGLPHLCRVLFNSNEFLFVP